jgi:ABC-type antimicrobial peptide transport system permease subunit
VRFIDYLIIAFRNLWRQKLRSCLTIFAVVIGATSVTIMLAVVFSIKSFITSQFEANGTFQQIAVSPQTDITWNDQGGGGANNCNNCVKLTDDLSTKISHVTHVIGVARVVQIGQFQALIYGDQKLRVNQIKAYDANGILSDTVLAGRDISANDQTGVLTLTVDYADKLGFKGHYQDLLGKKVNLLSQQWYTGVGSDPLSQYQQMQAWQQAHQGEDGGQFQPSPTTLSATVVGIVDSDRNNYAIHVPLKWAQGMMLDQRYQEQQQSREEMEAYCSHVRGQCSPPRPAPVLVTRDMLVQNGYDSFIVKADQSSNAPSIATTIRTTFKVGAADAQTQISQELGMFNIIGYVLGGIGGIALVVAAVGVVNTMIMSILERTREIGVMRAVGAKRSTVSRLFTIEASLLGLLGGVIGVGLGYGLILIANPILNRQLTGNNIQSANIIGLPLWLIFAVIGITTLIGMLAGLYPARRAAKLDPVEALRYE